MSTSETHLPLKRKNPESANKRKSNPRTFALDPEMHAYFATDGTNTTSLNATAVSVKLQEEVKFQQINCKTYVLSKKDDNHEAAYEKFETTCNSPENSVTGCIRVEIPFINTPVEPEPPPNTPSTPASFVDAEVPPIIVHTQAPAPQINQVSTMSMIWENLDDANEQIDILVKETGTLHTKTQTLKKENEYLEKEKRRLEKENQTLKHNLQQKSNLYETELKNLQLFIQENRVSKKANELLRTRNMELLQQNDELKEACDLLRNSFHQQFENNSNLQKINEKQTKLISELEPAMKFLVPHATTLQKHIRGFWGKRLLFLEKLKIKTCMANLLKREKFDKLAEISQAYSNKEYSKARDLVNKFNATDKNPAEETESPKNKL